MSTISQRIPNLFLGISQQPDSRKFPGQVRDAVNTLPDFALGMLKRPGGEYIESLTNATTTGRWFSILRDANEKYIAQYADNVFRIWSLIDGSPRAVNMGSNTGVPGGCVIANVKSTLANYNTAVALTKTRLTALNTAQSTYAETLAGQNATTEELFSVKYNYTPPSQPNSFYEVYLYSGIIKNAAGLYTVKNADTVVSTSVSLPAGYTLGTERTDEHPKLAAEGYRVFTAVHTVAATHNAGQLSAALAAMNTAQTNYNNAVTDEATKLGLYNTQVANCAITTVPANAYLKDANPEDIEVLTLNDYTFVLNKGKTAEMNAATTAALPNQALVTLSIVGSGHYKIFLDGTERATHNAGASSDADSILNDLVNDINNQTFGGKTYTATRVGPSIYITCTAAFSIQVLGGPSQESLSAFQDSVANVSYLPSQSKDGYVVKVINSGDVDVDDMWLKFNTSATGATYGVGTWEETVGPGITYQINPLTMPHQLVRQADGSFNFEPVVWDERVIGDLDSNPDPSFIGSQIKHIFLYRNRFGFLANESVVMSRAGDLFNFFNTTALTATDDDPIDSSASTAKPVTLHYVRPTAVGLILFGDTEQFLLSTDSDILSPKTAKINTMSSYECDPDIEAVSTGISTTFIAKTPLYTKVFNLLDIRNDSPPLAEELTLNIPELIPSTIDHFISSAGASIMSLGTIGSSTIYQFRFLQLSEKRVASWYKWSIAGTLLDQFFDQSTYYTVVANGTNVEVQSYNLRQSSDEGFLTLPTGEKTDVFLDYWSINPYRTYNSGTDTTRVFLPYNTVTGKTLVVVALGGYIGGSNVTSSQSVGAVLEPTVAGTTSAYYADIDGDYRGRDLIIGYQYEMSLELPTFYITKNEGNYISSDQTADLILHRINVATGLSGPVTYEIDLTGIPTWENVVSTTLPNTYILNNVNLSSGSVHIVPIYQRNRNTSIRIIGNTPFPVSLLDITWEGKYSSRFYRGG